MLKILVSGAGVGGHGEQIAKALRLSHLKLNIIGSDCQPENVRTDFFDEVLNMPRATDPDYDEALFNIIASKKLMRYFMEMNLKCSKFLILLKKYAKWACSCLLIVLRN